MRRYRRGLQVGLLVVIAAFIASLFVFGQRGFGDGAGRDAVATVNGESIPVSRYQRAYQAYVNMYSQMSRAPVTPAEVEHAFALRREEVRAAWALIELGPLIAAAAASDDELAKYLGAHQDEFRQPERRRIIAATLTPKDFVQPVASAAVEQYYREHPKEFEEPRRVHAAHVLARVPETGGSEAEDKARARVADVIRRAKAGEDFAKLAKETSEDPGSAPKGGDLGWVGAGELVPQFEQALFALKKGEMSPVPVRSPFGFHAIRVLDVRAGGKKPLKDVAGQIHGRLQTEATEKAMQARAEAIRRELLAAPDFTAEAKRLGLAAVESTVSRTDRFAGVRAPDPLEEAAFNLAQGGVSPPVKTPAGLERVAPDPGALAGERATVTKEVLAQKQSQAWESWLNAARVNAKVEVHFNPTSRRG